MPNETRLKLLSVQEVISQTNLFNEIEPSILVRGLKSSAPKNTDEERATVKSYLDDLHKVLSMERVALKLDRSVASIEDGKIKLIKRQGKWDAFEPAGDYLEPHVALFLMEINKLELYVGKAIVSLERAYHMFLNHESSAETVLNNVVKLTKNEYIVYSHFMRFGLVHLRPFKNQAFAQANSSDNDSGTDDELDETENTKSYVWNYLYELLGHRKSVHGSRNWNQRRYRDMKNSMDNIICGLKNIDQCTTNSDACIAGTSDSITVGEKRKLLNTSHSIEPVSKLSKFRHRHYADDQYYGSGSTNDFMVDGTVQRFKQIFEQIEIIDLKMSDSIDKQQRPLDEQFSFDLWTSFDYRKHSNIGPNFRLIVKHSSKSLPHNDDIFRLYHRLMHKSAIIVVCINEEMSFQAYIYRFTT